MTIHLESVWVMTCSQPPLPSLSVFNLNKWHILAEIVHYICLHFTFPMIWPRLSLHLSARPMKSWVCLWASHMKDRSSVVISTTETISQPTHICCDIINLWRSFQILEASIVCSCSVTYPKHWMRAPVVRERASELRYQNLLLSLCVTAMW